MAGEPQATEPLGIEPRHVAVGALAAGVAHDFNNILSIILTYVTLIMDELKPDDPIRADLEEVHGAAQRAVQLTRQLAGLGLQQVLDPRVLDLSQIVEEMQPTLHRLISEDIEIAVGASALPATVVADRGRLQQVVMNLVVNASEAMPRSGRVTIETACVELDTAAAGALELAPGPYATLTITDTGKGMGSTMVERIYEPFFTTREATQRTGLGPSIAFGIVKQCLGQIGVWSMPGQGTTFRAYFPCVGRRLDLVSVGKPSSGFDGAETILVVEDDASVRLAIGKVLRRHGYQVLEAENGQAALRVSDEFESPIDLLLTDVVMPIMSGRELAVQLAPLRPQMVVVYTSGHSQDAVVRHGVLEANVGFVAKPIVPGVLLRMLREALDAVTPRRGGSAGAPQRPPG